MTKRNSSEQDSDSLVIFDAEENSRRPIPDGWRLVKGTKKNGTHYSYYICPETKQRFSSYENLMRYVHYAEVALVSIYSPYFHGKPRKGDMPTSSNCQIVVGPKPGSDGEDESSDDTSSDSEDFDVPENVLAEEELNPIPDMYALPPMDSIVLLPNEEEETQTETGKRGQPRERTKRPSHKTKIWTSRFNSIKGKRMLRKRREDYMLLRIVPKRRRL
ncbi:PREDICTED: uncharacterized protein LOC104817277 isoform X1 [Tarenaya hassleriana]|uniref:uncharacterized protein LOC104817277 isoform X1 n=1 Tax=Tarenaya hassleriana TaxID=28532 RepID=UPI00053C77B6|nr:PREDICTED: uncharacterized protein LOC104817277 isoform X1 [Tarenaya hassleriana]XP_010544698.1 PREDICTED: uncharacterized protein LOC104817277 isoform X1 [Tarenaya hassleriana]XP_010544699.1 PREDICTED: uncharacterized protein LOC104817277 isoform X1 [Tarenaya hassleriana]XP_010544701.1 PREDICTED: uncharacterized protein LOC104817277 isoform X1 [Tarenaya hassleriana]XP_010544702.1 PREDICTED: uncharacterized protein LOC104817277 isoform X1 [Tarenaya hassleriana]XP_010544703.1 PREDICTED: unch